MDNNTTLHKVTLTPYDGTSYTRLDFDDKDGITLAALVAHKWTNPTVRPIDGVDYWVKYRHQHMTIYTTSDEQGSTMGVIDIPYGRDFTQIQIENADLVLKGQDTSLVLRSPNGHYWKVKVSDTGELSTEELPTDYIISSSSEYEIISEV